MSIRSTIYFIIVNIFASTSTVVSFQLITPSSTLRKQSIRLNLHPSQGSQLVAAWTASVDKSKITRENEERDLNSDEEKNNKNVGGKLMSARAFIAQLFAAEDHKFVPGLPTFTKEEEGDVVLYPLVGFRYVMVGPNEFRAVPTKSQASCILHNLNQADEELVGWYSVACHLDCFSDEKYCSEPNSVVEDQATKEKAGP